MTDIEIADIRYFHRKGLSQKEIAEETGISPDTIKTYMRRNKDLIDSICVCCGKKLIQRPRTKQKLFCSDTCRLAWWNARPGRVRRNRNERTCSKCGRIFLTHIQSQHYCSRKCYADARRKAVDLNG